MQPKYKIAIIGLGFVGKAVAYGFNNPKIEQQHIDPKLGTEIIDIHEDTNMVFVCVPTPMGNFLIIREVMEELLSNIDDTFNPIIIIKSTVTPDIIEEFDHPNVVYNPEFLKEVSAIEDFLNPQFQVFGGESDVIDLVEDLFDDYSLCNPTVTYKMSLQEASMVKYTINSFLATKVMFFNQIYDICERLDTNFNVIMNAVGEDTRIGPGHTKVPGYDGKRGFGGACLPKDTDAFVNMAHDILGIDALSILQEVIKSNNKIRSKYKKDKREKEQNIIYFNKEV
jgi:UDPglucose 6-dehydrogenase